MYSRNLVEGVCSNIPGYFNRKSFSLFRRIRRLHVTFVEDGLGLPKRGSGHGLMLWSFVYLCCYDMPHTPKFDINVPPRFPGGIDPGRPSLGSQTHLKT